MIAQYEPITYNIVKTNWPSLKKDLSGPAGVYGKPQFDNIQTNIFVEWVQY